MSLLGKIFVWWQDATPGTLLTTWFSGTAVGKDTFGNRYYQSKDGKRRWVLYAGTVEASRVPPEWHGWLHYTLDVPPGQRTILRHKWQKPHLPNLTGTQGAYVPPGHLLGGGERAATTADYEAWKP